MGEALGRRAWTALRRVSPWLLGPAALAAAECGVRLEEANGPAWRRVQASFRALEVARAEAPSPVGIRWVENRALDVSDRCVTCHLAIDRAGWDTGELPQVFRTHPRREELLGRHPVATFGCTPCHGGEGLALGDERAAPDRSGADPHARGLLAGPHAEASCPRCHAEEHEIEGAPTYARGRRLFERLRCSGCHATRNDASATRTAPPLGGLAQKMSQSFVERWLRSPSALRPRTEMPELWPSSSPAQPGSQQPEARIEQREREIEAIAAFVGTLGGAALPEAPELDLGHERAAEGRRLFDALGCRGCHTVGEGAEAVVSFEESFGPALDGIGERATARWLWAWLGRPKDVWPDARMPDPRLDEAERERLLAFLVSLRAEGVEPASARWQGAAQALVERGRELVVAYGCAGCHDVPGLVAAAAPGTDLRAFGDRQPEELPWGEARAACERPDLACWTVAKLLASRTLHAPGVVPVMPQYALGRDEALALSVFVLANRDGAAPPRTPGESERARGEGERVIERHNCRGCHAIAEGGTASALRVSGGVVARFYPDAALAPPRLAHAGMKFRQAWLSEFLRAPTRIRPWLGARMPTFDLDPAELSALVRYFASQGERALGTKADPELEGGAADREAARVLFDKLQCDKCHAAGATTETPAELAPDLRLAPARLRPEWARRWLLDPQALEPGTRMPTYFPLADDDDPTSATTPFPSILDGKLERQVDALVALLLDEDEIERSKNDEPVRTGGPRR